jgi:hypothetical protein
MQRWDSHLIDSSLGLEYNLAAAMREVHRHDQNLAVSPRDGT